MIYLSANHVQKPQRVFLIETEAGLSFPPGQIKCHHSKLTASQTEAPVWLIHQPPLPPPQHGALMSLPAELYFIRKH